MNVKLARPWRRKALWLLLSLIFFLAIANRSVRTWLPHRLANQALAADRLEDTRWWLDVAGRLGGDNPGTLFFRSRLARKAGDIEQAWQYLNEAEAQGLAADRVAREQILIRAQAGDVQDAQRLLAILLQGSPNDSPEVCEAFAKGFIRTHASMEMAVGLLNAWVVDYPNDPRPHMLLAELSLEAMDIENAVQEFDRVLKIDPEHGQAALSLGELMLQQHEPDQAMKLFHTATRNKGIRPIALIWQTRCLRTVGRTAEAQAVLDSALADAPNSVIGQIEQAHLEIGTGGYAAAAQRLQTILDREPFRQEARSALAIALRSMGRAKEARAETAIVALANSALVRAKHLARDVAIDPGNVELRAEIGQIHLKYGDPEKAREWLHSVLMFDPNHQQTRQTLTDFYENKSF